MALNSVAMQARDAVVAARREKLVARLMGRDRSDEEVAAARAASAAAAPLLEAAASVHPKEGGKSKGNTATTAPDSKATGDGRQSATGDGRQSEAQANSTDEDDDAADASDAEGADDEEADDQPRKPSFLPASEVAAHLQLLW